MQVKLLLRRAESRRLGGKPGCLYLAWDDVNSAKQLPQDAPTAKLIATAEAQLNFELDPTGPLVEEVESPVSAGLPLISLAGGADAAGGVKAAAKVPTYRSAVVSSSTGGRTLELVVELQGVHSFGELTLELSADRIFLSGADYLLDTPLAALVDAGSASAKFSSKKGTLTIKAVVV